MCKKSDQYCDSYLICVEAVPGLICLAGDVEV